MPLTDLEGKPRSRADIGAYAAVPTLGGAVLVLQPRAEAYLALDETQRAAGFAILVVITGAPSRSPKARSRGPQGIRSQAVFAGGSSY